MTYFLVGWISGLVGVVAGALWRGWVEEQREQDRRLDRIWLGVKTSIVADRFIKVREPEDFVRIVDHPAHPWKQN